MWARFPALLGFMQLAQAEPAMADKVVAGMQKFAVCMNDMLTANYTGEYYLEVQDTEFPRLAICWLPHARYLSSILGTNESNCFIGYLGTSDDLWGRARFQDMLYVQIANVELPGDSLITKRISLQWLYEHHPQNNGQILLDNMKMLTDAGYDWAYWYLDAFIKDNLYNVSPDIVDLYYHFEHGVNAGQGIYVSLLMGFGINCLFRT